MTTTIPQAPAGAARLLELLATEPGRVSFENHTRRYGDLPLRGYGGPRGPLPLADTIEAADLRGRGGAGFPLAVKMRAVAKRDRGTAAVVANGAESEPLSQKDQLLLTRLPHLVIDGAVLVADSVGAGSVELVAHVGAAYDAAAAALGERRDRISVRLHAAPDGYVSSQDTALIQWLNGGPALPTFTPPLPVHAGVRRRPTVVANVETLAHVALLARFGTTWYRGVGSDSSHGTALVTASGAVRSAGVLEVPFGMRIADILGTVGADPASTALLVGGWFGGWLPMHRARDLRLDPEVLRTAGTGLGAGVLHVLPPRSCGLRYVADATDWLAAQSAGQCGPCINGLPAIATAMRAVAQGRGVDAATADLRRWTALVVDRGACRHPDGVSRFVATALRVFAQDVDAHRHGRCGVEGAAA